MKKVLIPILLLGLLFACKSDDTIIRNPYLQSVRFNYEINLALNTNLSFNGNSAYFPNAGIKGIIVHNSGNTYLAWDASCPNHRPSDCSTLTISGVTAVCSCEDYKYSLSLGQLFNPPNDGSTIYPLLNYRATESGGIITVTN
jgi:nitrite reductase/ring-hydroxylating ferredoxin subunit